MTHGNHLLAYQDSNHIGHGSGQPNDNCAAKIYQLMLNSVYVFKQLHEVCCWQQCRTATSHGS